MRRGRKYQDAEKTGLRIGNGPDSDLSVKAMLIEYANRLLGGHELSRRFLGFVLSLLDIEARVSLLDNLYVNSKRKSSSALYAERCEDLTDPDDLARDIIRDIDARRIRASKKDLEEYVLGLWKKGKSAADKEHGRFFQGRLSDLEDLFHLSSDDIKVFRLLYCHKQSETFESLSNDYNLPNFLKFVSIAANLPLTLVKDRLSRKGKLIQSGLVEPLSSAPFYRLEDEIVEYMAGISDVPLIERYLRRDCNATYNLSSFNLPVERIHIVRDLLSCSRPCNILLYGDAGTGKTEFARSVVKVSGKETVFLQHGEESRTSDRRSALQVAANTIPPGKGVVIVDEADTLLNTRYMFLSSKHTVDKGWLNNFLDHSTGKIIWITNDTSSMEESLLRRFSYSLHFRRFSKCERENIWVELIKDHPLKRFLPKQEIQRLAAKYQVNLERLGHQTVDRREGPMSGPVYAHPDGRKVIFLGDMIDRGPRILDTLKLIYNMVSNGCALCVPGNHDIKLLQKLRGKQVQIAHGLAESLAEFEALPSDIREPLSRELIGFLDGLVSHYVLDGGKLIVAHAGLKQEMQGRSSRKVREFCLYGETTGETDEFGLPVRCNWAAEYRGSAMVVYGHTPVPYPEWLNHTINIDTGCVFGGKLTAFRYPEKELVSVPARNIYCNPVRPFQETPSTALSAQHEIDDVLHAEDVLGKRIITTRLRPHITIREENAMAAFEVMSRFAANPKWLIYLPPTMSPSETSQKEDYLEYPEEAFSYYRSHGLHKVICEEKHMGSRAVVIVCKDENAAFRQFGIKDENAGIVYTRTGRRFFNDSKLEAAFLNRIRAAFTKSGFWAEFNTDWVCLDCELMPWSAKAQDLVKTQYAAVGAAANAALADSIDALAKTAARNDLIPASESSKSISSAEMDIDETLGKFNLRKKMAEQYIQAYQRYCWPVASVHDYKLAPFHLLATEGKVHTDKDHEWHIKTLSNACATDKELLTCTAYVLVDVTDSESQNKAIKWWEDLTNAGGEGMVVKPYDFVSAGRKGMIQPALKCRGREYLRIIYGPEYTADQNLNRLRQRTLSRKRSLALREFVLGIEALERFVRKEPLRRVHECVFGILALESEPVDPRL